MVSALHWCTGPCGHTTGSTQRRCHLSIFLFPWAIAATCGAPTDSCSCRRGDTRLLATLLPKTMIKEMRRTSFEYAEFPETIGGADGRALGRCRYMSCDSTVLFGTPVCIHVSWGGETTSWHFGKLSPPPHPPLWSSYRWQN